MSIIQVATIVLLAAVAGVLIVFVLEMRHMRLRWSKVGPWDFPFHGIPHLELWEIINVAERESTIRLTWGARQMLMIPVIETIEFEGSVNWQDVQRSINDIVRNMAEVPDVPLRPGRVGSSVAVIDTFYRRFCNIPPFCARQREQTG